MSIFQDRRLKSDYFKVEFSKCRLYSVVKRTPAIIKTHFLAGKVFVIAEQINAMKEYSKNFAAYANNIEASVEKFEQAVEFFKKNKIVL